MTIASKPKVVRPRKAASAPAAAAVATTTSSWITRLGLSVGGFLLLLIIMFFVLPEKKITIAFKNIGELKSYASSMEDDPDMDNTNIIKPDYTKFYQKHLPSYFNRRLNSLLMWLHCAKKPAWSVDATMSLLQSQLALHEKSEQVGEFIYKVLPKSSTEFVIFGDVQAAYHSMVRNIERLIEIGILNKDLKVVKPDCFIVFMGNVIDRAAYSLETLTVAMRLVEENPKNVFYLRGNHENNDYWHEYGLKQELIIRASQYPLDKNKIPLGETFSKYFNTLGSALYISVIPKNESEFVRVSREVNEEESTLKLDEGKFSQFLEKPIEAPEFISLFNLKQQKDAPEASKVTLRAIVKSEKKRRTFQSMDGIRLLSPEKGVTAWTLLSCPTKVYQKGIKFYNDAFGVLSCATKIEDWQITLHSQDTRTKAGYKTRIYNLLSGQELGAEVSKVPAADINKTQASTPAKVDVPAPAATPAPAKTEALTPAPAKPAEATPAPVKVETAAKPAELPVAPVAMTTKVESPAPAKAETPAPTPTKIETPPSAPTPTVQAVVTTPPPTPSVVAPAKPAEAAALPKAIEPPAPPVAAQVATQPLAAPALVPAKVEAPAPALMQPAAPAPMPVAVNAVLGATLPVEVPVAPTPTAVATQAAEVTPALVEPTFVEPSLEATPEGLPATAEAITPKAVIAVPSVTKAGASTKTSGFKSPFMRALSEAITLDDAQRSLLEKILAEEAKAEAALPPTPATTPPLDPGQTDKEGGEIPILPSP